MKNKGFPLKKNVFEVSKTRFLVVLGAPGCFNDLLLNRDAASPIHEAHPARQGAMLSDLCVGEAKEAPFSGGSPGGRVNQLFFF